MSRELVTIRARFVFAGAGAPVRDGLLTIRDGLVERIEPAGAERPSQDLGNVAIIPPLVNAHTHLEFSDLSHPVAPGATFADWVRAVLDVRMHRDPSVDPIKLGLRESEHAGVARVGEIATSVEIPAALDRSPVGGTRFLELIGSTPSRADDCLRQAAAYLTDRDHLPTNWQAGLSPHAPYTTSLELVRATVGLAGKYNVPVAMHLAETQEELQLLWDHTGPLRELLEERDVWNAAAFPPGTRPLDYLRVLVEAPHALIVHGNYLDDDELAFIAAHDNLSLVFCPRTHAFFGHQDYPLRQALDSGVRVRVGTDSRASNPDLSLWNELRFIADTCDVTQAELLKMATASSLDRWGGAGLEIGTPAEFTIVQLEGASDELMAARCVERYSAASSADD